MEVHVFDKSIGLKVDLIAQMDFELAYYDARVKHVSYKPTGTNPTLNKYTTTNCLIINQGYQDFINYTETLPNKNRWN